MFPGHCLHSDPDHIQREWGNVLIPRLSGDFHSPSLLLPFPNMEPSTVPKHPRATSIQHDSDVGRTPSYPSSHYTSSTKIGDANANLKTILATRVSFNDPNIVDVLVKPDEVSADIVKALQDYISKHKLITRFLDDVAREVIPLESHMYTPLVRRDCCLCFEF